MKLDSSRIIAIIICVFFTSFALITIVMGLDPEPIIAIICALLASFALIRKIKSYLDKKRIIEEKYNILSTLLSENIGNSEIKKIGENARDIARPPQDIIAKKSLVSPLL
mgnify:CR=1 FL=1